MVEKKPLRGRRACWVALVYGLPLGLFWGDTLLALGLGWRPYGTVEWALLGVGGLFAAAGAAAVLRGRWRAGMEKRVGEAALVLVATVLSVALLEGAAFCIERRLHPPKQFHTRGPNLREVFRPAPEMLAGIEDASRFTTGPRGIRAATPHGGERFRWLCVGGSTTECLYLDDTEAWPARLMQYSNEDLGADTLWVGNAGVSGFYTQHHRRFLETNPLLDGVDAVVVQCGINDLDAFLWAYGAPPEPPRAETPPPEAQASRPVWARANLIQLFHTLRQGPPDPYTVESMGAEVYAERRARRAQAVKHGTVPDLSAALRDYRANLEALIAACRAREVDILFTTQPVLWRAGLSEALAARCWMGRLGDGTYLEPEAARRAIEAYNRTLRETCRAQGVACVSLDAMNGVPEYFYDDCHFTERGAEETARLILPLARTLLNRENGNP